MITLNFLCEILMILSAKFLCDLMFQYQVQTVILNISPVKQGYFIVNTGYDSPLPLSSVVPPSLQVFRASNIEYFHSGLKVFKEYSAGDIINVNKNLYYHDVLLFVQQVKHVTSIKQIENLSLCL